MSDGDLHHGEHDLCVSKVPLFAGLSHEDQVAVASLARPTRVEGDESVYQAGSDSSQLMVVHSGAVKITRIDRDGREQILRVLGPGDFMGESAFLTGRRPHHFATALEPATMCVFRHADLSRLVREHPSVGQRMLEEVSRRLEETENRLTAVVSGDVASRLAEYILSLPGREVERGIEVELPIAKKDVASLLDTTPESLSRQLRRLQQSGAIESLDSRRLLILDFEALLELADQL